MSSDQTTSTAKDEVWELATSFVGLGVCATGLWIVGSFPQQAQAYPRFIFGGLLIFLVAQIAKSGVALVNRRNVSDEAPTTDSGSISTDVAEDEDDLSEEEGDPEPAKQRSMPGNRNLLILLAGLAAYILLMPVLGYITATSLYLIAALSHAVGFSGRRSVAIVAGVAFTTYGVSSVLGIQLPSGWFA